MGVMTNVSKIDDFTLIQIEFLNWILSKGFILLSDLLFNRLSAIYCFGFILHIIMIHLKISSNSYPGEQKNMNFWLDKFDRYLFMYSNSNNVTFP